MYFLGHWVRDLGKLDLVAAIKKLTSDVADIYGLPNRGRLVEGAYADMILFDPKQIGISNTQRLNDLPSGATRLVRSAPGLHTVWVNGVGVYHDGDYMAVTPPGQVLTEFSAIRPRIGMDH
jgi:N-acyl-D-aspartate/D-glutamate deacylase